MRQWSASFYRWNWQWQGKNATQVGSLKNKRPRKIRRGALPSVRKAKGISLTAHNKAADLEDDILHFTKRKLQLESIKLRLEIKRLRKDLDNLIILSNSVQIGIYQDDISNRLDSCWTYYIYMVKLWILSGKTVNCSLWKVFALIFKIRPWLPIKLA